MVTDELEKYLKDYECKYHTSPSMNNPYGCTDCYNTGTVIDSEESGLIFHSYKRIKELEDDVKILQKHIRNTYIRSLS